MKVKRFVAPDMRQAIRRVREEQGADAVILSSKKTDDGVEIVSAIDFDESTVQRLMDNARAAKAAGDAAKPQASVAPRRAAPSDNARAEGAVGARAAQGRPAALAAAEAEHAQQRAQSEQTKPAAAHAASEPQPARQTVHKSPSAASSEHEEAIATLRSELRSMRGLLEHELTALAGSDFARREPVRAEILRRLEKLGLGQSTARNVIDHLGDASSLQTGWREALMRLARSIPIAERNPLVAGGRIALVGPTGVGKTMTARKIAADFAAQHGRQSLALIACDTDRLDAQREMLALGQSLGIYTLTAATARELRDALDTVADRRLVLIDTAGMSYRDPRLSGQAHLLTSLPGTETWLTLAANAQRGALEAAIRNFAGLRPRACVLTKLDECTSLGEPVDALIRSGLPLSHVSAAQEGTEGFERAHGGRLVRRMVKLTQEHGQAGQAGDSTYGARGTRPQPEQIDG